VLSVLDNLADSLALATIDENWKHRVGRQTELRAKFNAPDLTVRQLGHFQIINLEGHEITIGSMATDEQIATEIERLRGPKPPPIPAENPKMSITGLKSGAFHGTIEALRQRLIDKQNQGAAKIAAAGEMGAAKIDQAVNSAEAKIDKEVSEVLQDFSEFTNGGPA
jgi:hypothetical protein